MQFCALAVPKATIWLTEGTASTVDRLSALAECYGFSPINKHGQMMKEAIDEYCSKFMLKYRPLVEFQLKI